MTSDAWTKLKALSARLAAAKMPQLGEIRFEVDGAAREIQRDDAYFGLTISQLNLAEGRQWWSEYEPLVYAAVDFVYGTERVTIPKLIGPSTLKETLADTTGRQLPHGFVVRNISVAGPYPYRGGPIGLTVILFKVRSNNYAKRVVRVVESLSTAVSLSDMKTVMKIGGSVLDSVEALFGMEDCTPVLGHRVEYPTTPLGPLHPTTVALGVAPGQGLTLVDGQLRDASSQPYAAADFVLYRIWGADTFPGPETTLSFHPQVLSMNAAASQRDDQAWERAKAALLTLYEQMRTSPDVTAKDAERYLVKYQDGIVDLRKKVLAISLLGEEQGRAALKDEIVRQALNTRTKEILNLRIE